MTHAARQKRTRRRGIVRYSNARISVSELKDDVVVPVRVRVGHSTDTLRACRDCTNAARILTDSLTKVTCRIVAGRGVLGLDTVCIANDGMRVLETQHWYTLPSHHWLATDMNHDMRTVQSLANSCHTTV